MSTITHVVFGLAATLMTWRALEQPWVDALGDPRSGEALRYGLPAALAAGSLLSLVAGVLGRDPLRALRHDALSVVAALAGIFVLALGGLPRDVIGIVFVLVVAARVAPAAWWTVRYGAPRPFVFAVALAFYAPLAAWRVAASLPLGDQVFYLLSADRLTHGSLDAHIDPLRFVALLGIQPGPVDAATHVAATAVGDRLVQGYALPALLAPGWALAGQLGATLVLSLFAAWAAMETWSLLGETVDDPRVARSVWLLATASAPLALLAVHVLPNAVGAALVATGYRHAFTARVRRPVVAGLALGATSFLNPRDGLVLLVIGAFALAWDARSRVRFVASAAAVVIAAAVVDLVTFGIPVPYAGYLYGTAAAQTIDPEPTWTFRFWIGLPAILFDRVFGVAGTAPWLLVAAVGLAPALARARARLLPAAVTIGASLVLLSLFRLWEGGYAPPNRYLVDVLPLAAPFVAFGLVAARSLALRVVVALGVLVSALMTAFLLAVPSAALNTAFEDKPQLLLTGALGIDPVGWLPSFQPVTADWWLAAYARLVPGLALLAFLVWQGARRVRT